MDWGDKPVVLFMICMTIVAAVGEKKGLIKTSLLESLISLGCYVNYIMAYDKS